MDELEIQGKKYISSKRAAELTGYAKDYIGQLSRGGKIEAMRVGKAWYVLREAILRHKGFTAEEAKEPKTPDRAASVVGHQRPISLGLIMSRVELPKTWETVKYFDDEGDLFPKLINRKEPEMTKNDIVFPAKEVSEPISIRRFTDTPIDGIVIKKTLQEEVGNYRARPIHRSSNKNKDHSNIVFELAGGTSALALVVFLFASGFIASDWHISSSGAASFKAISGDTALWDEILHSGYGFLREGFALIGAFFSYILSSFWSLFHRGLDFILKLFNLG